MLCGWSVGDAFEVVVAAGSDEEMEEDGEVVAGVDEGGAGYGVGSQAHDGEDNGDAEEQDENGPGESYLLAVKRGEEDAGEDRGEDDGRRG